MLLIMLKQPPKSVTDTEENLYNLTAVILTNSISMNNAYLHRYRLTICRENVLE